ncbi:MAG: hypothetical protein AB201_01960 [Parcubacteria bacterium C7867-006]|nr:MAG: hypothetical protein AB201_01960 [Parcubacteria bacterium C7867-006]
MNTENTQINNIKDQILNKINSGEVNMKPKYYFMLKLALLGVTIFLTFILSSIIVSYVLFSIKVSGQFFLLGFGAKGFYHFIMALPWVILGIDIALIIFLDWLLKSFRFGYNSPVLFLFIGTLASITLLGSLINFTSFHKGLLYRAEQKNLPIAGGFYMGLRKSHGNQGIFRGEIISIEGTSTFYMKYNDYDSDADDMTIEVFVPGNTDVYSLSLNPGDQIFIAGDKMSDGIRAYGMRKLTNEQ